MPDMLIRCSAILLMWLASCTDRNTPVRQEQYFDNKSWFQQELLTKKRNNPEIIKQLRVDGDSSGLSAIPESWEKELGIFLETDLTKSVYAGKFRVDTLELEQLPGRKILITYSAQDSNINIRKFSVMKSGDVVSLLSAELFNQSPLLRSSINWTYQPDSGYVLKGIHEMKGIRKNEFEVTARFRFNQ